MPSTEKCIDDEVHLFGGNLKQIERLKKTIGLDKRRVVDSKTTALDLCEAAVQRLFEGLNLTVDAVNALFLSRKLLIILSRVMPQFCMVVWECRLRLRLWT